MTDSRKIETEEQARAAAPPFKNRWSNDGPSPEFCCASVHNGGRSVSFHQCTRKPKNWYGTLGYCDTHDPNKFRERRDKKQAEWQAKWNYSNRLHEFESRQRKFKDACVQAVRQIAAGHNDPRSLCSELLAQEPKMERSP